jgi:hypothetical protein
MVAAGHPAGTRSAIDAAQRRADARERAVDAPIGRVLVFALPGDRGLRCGVAGQDLLKQLGSGPGMQAPGLDHRMRVPVPDHRSSAGE